MKKAIRKLLEGCKNLMIILAAIFAASMFVCIKNMFTVLMLFCAALIIYQFSQAGGIVLFAFLILYILFLAILLIFRGPHTRRF